MGREEGRSKNYKSNRAEGRGSKTREQDKQQKEEKVRGLLQKGANAIEKYGERTTSKDSEQKKKERNQQEYEEKRKRYAKKQYLEQEAQTEEELEKKGYKQKLKDKAGEKLNEALGEEEGAGADNKPTVKSVADDMKDVAKSVGGNKQQMVEDGKKLLKVNPFSFKNVRERIEEGADNAVKHTLDTAFYGAGTGAEKLNKNLRSKKTKTGRIRYSRLQPQTKVTIWVVSAGIFLTSWLFAISLLVVVILAGGYFVVNGDGNATNGGKPNTAIEDSKGSGGGGTSAKGEVDLPPEMKNQLVHPNNKIVSSPYKDPNRSPLHWGTDWSSRDISKPAVYSNCEGEVIKIVDNVRGLTNTGGEIDRGNYVLVHCNKAKITVLNQHLAYNSIPKDIKVGAKVKVDSLLGISGNTGQVYGIHLHLETFKAESNSVSYYNRAYSVNPLNVITCTNKNDYLSVVTGRLDATKCYKHQKQLRGI